MAAAVPYYDNHVPQSVLNNKSKNHKKNNNHDIRAVVPTPTTSRRRTTTSTTTTPHTTTIKQNKIKNNSQELARLQHYLGTQVSRPYQLELRGCRHQTLTISSLPLSESATLTTTTTTITTPVTTTTSHNSSNNEDDGTTLRKKQKTNHAKRIIRQVFSFTNVTTPAILGALRRHARPRQQQQHGDDNDDDDLVVLGRGPTAAGTTATTTAPMMATKIILLELYHDQLLQVLYDHDDWLQSSNVEELIIANSYCCESSMQMSSSAGTTFPNQQDNGHVNPTTSWSLSKSLSPFQRLTHLSLTSCHWPDSLYQALIRSCCGTLQHLSCHLWAGGPKSICNLLGNHQQQRQQRPMGKTDCDEDENVTCSRNPTTLDAGIDMSNAHVSTTTTTGGSSCSNTYLPQLLSLDLRGSLTCDDDVAMSLSSSSPFTYRVVASHLAPRLTTVVLIPTWQSQQFHLHHVLVQLGIVNHNHNHHHHHHHDKSINRRIVGTTENDPVSNARSLPSLSNHQHRRHPHDVSSLETIILGKMMATSEDMNALGAYLMRDACCLRQLHLLSLEFPQEVLTTMTTNDHTDDDKNNNATLWQDSFLQSVRQNRSLMEITLVHTTTATTTAANHKCQNDAARPTGTVSNSTNRVYQEEMRNLMMRNNYLTHGLERLEDARWLPHYIAHATTTTTCPTDVLYFMVRERPDLFVARET